MEKMDKYAIIVAGGTGTRVGGDIPKQFQLLKGKPLLWHTLKAFTDSYKDIQIILVLPEAHIDKGQQIIKEFTSHSISITTGGETRFQSVKNGLQLVNTSSVVLVHDAARCLITPQLIHRCTEEALQKGNAVPAVAATDTIRIESSGGNQQADRNQIRIIQTPQAFLSDSIKTAFDRPYHLSFTDEASVVEKTGIKINLVQGEETNIKITKPLDILIAQSILESRSK